MAQECVTHHICDCKQEQLDSLLAERERMLDLLERITGDRRPLSDVIKAEKEAIDLLRQAGRNQPQ